MQITHDQPRQAMAAALKSGDNFLMHAATLPLGQSVFRTFHARDLDTGGIDGRPECIAGMERKIDWQDDGISNSTEEGDSCGGK